MVRSYSAFLLSSAAATDALSQIVERAFDVGRKEELQYAACVSGRRAIQEYRAVPSERIFIAGLGDDSEHGEVIAQNANAAWSGVTS